MFAARPHVGVVSLVGKVVGLVPGVLSGIVAAEALQAYCASKSRARHLGLVLALGEKWAPNAAESLAAAAVPGLAPRLASQASLMEDLRELAAVLAAHAVWEQQLGHWQDPSTGPSGSLAVPPHAGSVAGSFSIPPPHRGGSGSTSSSAAPEEVTSLQEVAARAALAFGHGSGPGPGPGLGPGPGPGPGQPAPVGAPEGNGRSGSSNQSTNAQQTRLGLSGSGPSYNGAYAPAPHLQPPLQEQQPYHHHHSRQPPQHLPNPVPSLLWISAAAVARGMIAHTPSDRLRVLAVLVPPPDQHNSGWKGQAALITCLAASTAASANMFLMGMMAIHHLSNVFAGEGAALLNQLKLGCATLLALAPDEASAIAGCYFMELCVAIVAVSPQVGGAAAAAGRPPSSTISSEVVVDHALSTLLTLLEREGAPSSRPAVVLASLQSLWRLLRHPCLPQVTPPPPPPPPLSSSLLYCSNLLIPLL